MQGKVSALVCRCSYNACILCSQLEPVNRRHRLSVVIYIRIVWERILRSLILPLGERFPAWIGAPTPTRLNKITQCALILQLISECYSFLINNALQYNVPAINPKEIMFRFCRNCFGGSSLWCCFVI